MQERAISEAAPETVRRRRRTVQKLKAMRSIADRVFRAGLCRDWNLDILLLLYESYLDGASITTRQFAAMTGFEQGAALRRLYVLERWKLVERSLDLEDRRRSVVYLTERGIDSVENLIDCYADLLLQKRN